MRRRWLVPALVAGLAPIPLVVAAAAQRGRPTQPQAALAPDSAPAPKSRKPRREKSTTSSAPEQTQDRETVNLSTEDALERMKLLRIQMALDRQEIEALQLRLDKIRLQNELALELDGLDADSAQSPGPRPTKKRRSPRRRSISDQLLVKAVVSEPVKEAIVLFEGRVYRLREGDRIGDLEVAAIRDSEISFQTAGGRRQRVGVGATVR